MDLIAASFEGVHVLSAEAAAAPQLHPQLQPHAGTPLVGMMVMGGLDEEEEEEEEEPPDAEDDFEAFSAGSPSPSTSTHRFAVGLPEPPTVSVGGSVASSSVSSSSAASSSSSDNGNTSGGTGSGGGSGSGGEGVVVDTGGLGPSLMQVVSKPHVCTACGKLFKWDRNLARHKLVHTGQKPHQCPNCD